MTATTALTLIERTLPPVWVDLWAGRKTPETFRLNSWGEPHTYFLVAANFESIVPGLTGLCPLVERNGEAIMGWLPDGRFVQFYYEDASKGDAAITVLGRNYQEFVLSLLLELEDAGQRDEWGEFAAACDLPARPSLSPSLIVKSPARRHSEPSAIRIARNR
jgi:hypothetical protein